MTIQSTTPHVGAALPLDSFEELLDQPDEATGLCFIPWEQFDVIEQTPVEYFLERLSQNYFFPLTLYCGDSPVLLTNGKCEKSQEGKLMVSGYAYDGCRVLFQDVPLSYLDEISRQ